MTLEELLALLALALFIAVSLWLGLTGPNTKGEARLPLASRPPVALLGHTTLRRLPLLTPAEDRICADIEAHLARRDDGHRVLPKVALAALLDPVPSGHPTRDAAARAVLTARRLDFAILDARNHLAAAVTLDPPDDLTRCALDRAAIPLLCASPGDSDLTARIDVILRPATGVLAG